MKNFNNDKTVDTETNKMVYHCAICGKPYDTVDERVACETKCLAARKRLRQRLKKRG